MNREPLPISEPDYFYHPGNARLASYSWYASRSTVNRVRVFGMYILDMDGQPAFILGARFVFGQDIEVLPTREAFENAIQGMEFQTRRNLPIRMGWDRDGYYGSSVGVYLDKQRLMVNCIDFPRSRYHFNAISEITTVNDQVSAWNYERRVDLHEFISYQDLTFETESFNEQSYKYVKGLPTAFLEYRPTASYMSTGELPF